MSESFMLCVFSIAMFLGSYLSGLVPLAFNLSEVSSFALKKKFIEIFFRIKCVILLSLEQVF